MVWIPAGIRDFLVDPSGRFVVETIIAAFALTATILIPILQRKRKELSYELKSSPLLSVSEEIQSKVQIFFEGRQLKNIDLTQARIVNSGDVPIAVNDFHRPITFTFAETANVLTATVIASSPANVDAEVSQSAHTVTLHPVLLNPGDVIKLKIILTQFDGKVSVDGRIVGVQYIRKASGKVWIRLRVAFVGLLVIACGRVLFPSAEHPVVTGVFMALGGGIITWGVMPRGGPRLPTEL